MNSTPHQTFEHSLFVLPPVADRSEVLWFAFIDAPGAWRGMAGSIDGLIATVADRLRAIVAYDRGPKETRSNPNVTRGPVRPLPNIPPRWIVSVVADCQEEGEPFWTFALQDESMWGVEDPDVRSAASKLARHIAAASVPVQPLLSTVPPSRLTVQTAKEQKSFEDATLERLRHVTDAIVAEQAKIAAVEQRAKQEQTAALDRISSLRIEELALTAAIRAYRAKANRPRKVPGRKLRKPLEASA